MRGKSDAEAAQIEALEEAGVRGTVADELAGSYYYWRRTRKDFRSTEVIVFAMLVEQERRSWKEKAQRTRQWFDVFAAAEAVLEPELSTLLLRLPANASIDRLLESR